MPDSIPYGGKEHECTVESTRKWDFLKYVEIMDSATLSLIVTILSVREIVFSKKLGNTPGLVQGTLGTFWHFLELILKLQF